ncbi:MAG: response regulator transcription factor [Rhodocyclaceae bacterium]|nr:response regulator transcription factor [Rhodocyclaceae bacterium]
MSGVMSILLVEDDPPLADGISRRLRHAGYAVEWVGSAGAACAALDTHSFRLVILDLGLPDLDGSAVVEHLARRRLDTPVLVLSARDGFDERVRLLDLGADDYLVKPAALEELLARVRAILRRQASSGEHLVLGRLRLDLEGKRAYLDETPLKLNGREWALLSFLAANPNRILSREELAAALYREGQAVSDNAIEQIVSRFRRCIGAYGLNLRTVRGLGYFFAIGEDEGGG